MGFPVHHHLLLSTTEDDVDDDGKTFQIKYNTFSSVCRSHSKIKYNIIQKTNIDQLEFYSNRFCTDTHE